jgi:2-isopropylmalate synthase
MPSSGLDIEVYDTTLRDGVQQEGIALSVGEKLAVARRLDDFGVAYIEGGWPGAIPKDTEFFARARRELALANATLVAFGATRRPDVDSGRDEQLAALLRAETEVVTLVAKSHDRHVELALRTSLQQNLAMVEDSVRYLVRMGRRVFVDAEHFFDGHRDNPGYALDVVRAAAQAGAEAVVLCDTNGGTLPGRIRDAVASTAAAAGVPIGIHCHDDAGCAVANTLIAVEAGATQVQATANGYGERSGNANLFTVVADLRLKQSTAFGVEPDLADMTSVARSVAELAAAPVPPSAPYVGERAFTHKGGLHASAVRVDGSLYEHVRPVAVGNRSRALVSDMAGRSSIEMKARELGLVVDASSAPAVRAVSRVKDLERQGFAFESADASFELLLREELSGAALPTYFEVLSWQTSVRRRLGGSVRSTATVELGVGPHRLSSRSEGNGPINALDRALREGLEPFFPALSRLALVDYRVRILPQGTGTASTTRVLITFNDGERTWSTVGVDENMLAASWSALLDAMRYALVPPTARDPLSPVSR